MASENDPLLGLLLPYLPPGTPPPPPSISEPYLSRITSLSLEAIQTTEPASLASTLQSVNLNIQSLASRSHRNLIASAAQLSTLSTSVSSLRTSLDSLKSSLPPLDDAITSFGQTYARDSAPLQARSKAHLVSTNLERLLDILQLPSLLQSLIASSQYPTALDLLAHVRRLRAIYPDSPTIASVSADCDTLQRTLCENLVTTLRGPLKLPVAMKTVGYLRRASGDNDERALRGIFLASRRAYLAGLLDALAPLRELAEEERKSFGGGRARSAGMQTERFLKRWIEVFREQSFGVVSMYRSIFPNALPTPSSGNSTGRSSPTPVMSPSPPPPGMSPKPVRPLTPAHSRSSSTMSVPGDGDDPEGGSPPDPLSGFIPHLVDLLVEVLQGYLHVIEEKSVRESLLTQVLYASGSLGRLGGEFAGVLGAVEMLFGGEEGEEEWVAVVGKHKVLASRLETLAAGGRA